jgi:hypothetical protein
MQKPWMDTVITERAMGISRRNPESPGRNPTVAEQKGYVPKS